MLDMLHAHVLQCTWAFVVALAVTLCMATFSVRRITRARRFEREWEALRKTFNAADYEVRTPCFQVEGRRDDGNTTRGMNAPAPAPQFALYGRSLLRPPPALGKTRRGPWGLASSCAV